MLLFEPEVLPRLERLRLAASDRVRGSRAGERRSRARGQGGEFSDHRAYVPGDDLKRLDWNLYGRLDRLYLRQFEEEREPRVLLLLDSSESMAFGSPSKFEMAVRVAGAVGYSALCGFDRVALRTYPTPPAERGPRTSTDWRGRRVAGTFLQHLASLKPGGTGDFRNALRRAAFETRQAGAAVVVGDFLDPAGYADGLSALVARGFRVEVVQVLCREELEPSAYGDLVMVDSETGSRTEVTFRRHRLAEYRRSLEAFLAEFERFCRARGIRRHLVDAGAPVEDVIFRQFRAGGLWQG